MVIIQCALHNGIFRLRLSPTLNMTQHAPAVRRPLAVLLHAKAANVITPAVAQAMAGVIVAARPPLFIVQKAFSITCFAVRVPRVR